MTGAPHAPRHRDRSTRLILFGVVATAVGALTVLIGLAQPFATRLLADPEAPGLDPRLMIVGTIVYGALGALLIWAGVGSMRKRRWVRSMMLTIGWSWLLFGLLALPMSLGSLDGILDQAETIDAPLPDEVRLAVKIFVVAIVSAGGILLPLLFLSAYRDRDVFATCAAANPEPDWSDRCSPTVLGLSIGWVAMGVLSIPMSIYGVIPLFGTLVTGWPAVVLTLLLAAGSLYLARMVFLARIAGWWGSTILLTAVGVSTAHTFLIVDPGEYLLLTGYPEEQVQSMGLSGSVVVTATIAMTAISIGYMVAIRHHFGGGHES